jgi:hypothetical protein
MKEIPVHRWVGGSKRWPQSLQFKVVGFTKVDDWWYARLIAMGRWMEVRKRDRLYVCLQGVNPRLYLHQVVGGKGWDHKDGDGLNNQESNLRSATRGQQTVNQRIHRDSTSGEPGVTFHQQTGKWRVQVKKDKKLVFYKVVDTKAEAIALARQKRREIHGEFVRT